MQPLWGKKTIFDNDFPIFGISIDSRNTIAGDLFIAIKGENYDGHHFIEEAFKKGAAGAIVEYLPENVDSKRCILVENSLNALQEMAIKRRSESKAVFFAVTGSVGKTTTKEAISELLKYNNKKIFRSQKSYNNHLGVSLTLASIPLECEYAVLEIGMNAPGEIESLAALVKPHYSVISHITAAHMLKFDKLQDVAIEKGSILKYTTKAAFFNEQMWYTKILKDAAFEKRLELLTFANKNEVTNVIKAITEKIADFLNLKNNFNFDLLSGRGKEKISKFNGYKIRVLDDAYNANPGSMVMGLKNLAKFECKKIAILGEMKELGRRSKRYHEALSCYLKDIETILCGNEMQALAKKMNGAIWFENAVEIAENIKNFIKQDCTILVKGSNSNNMKVIVDALL